MNKADTEHNSKASPPTLKDGLKELILDALKVRYISESCKDQIQTGNHYQSVALGGIPTAGFRTDRAEFLNAIRFEGKKVLDLGSNLGEISRMARDRGASLVDGFEYDPYFLETARAINAYNDVTRVSFYQRDITDPVIYGERYDIVLAFSVYIYIAGVLDKLEEITNELLVVETHRLDDNLESEYLKNIRRYFPYFRMLGHTEWGTTVDDKVRRAVIVFAKKPEVLEAGLVSGSVISPIRAEAREKEVEVDIFRTARWCDRFFTKFNFASVEDLITAIDGMNLDASFVEQSKDLHSKVMSGWLYWLLYIKGYLQFQRTKKIGADNVYFDYLIRYFGPQGCDPGLQRVLTNEELARGRVVRRFQDFHLFLKARMQGATSVTGCDPIKILVGDPEAQDSKTIYTIGSDQPLKGGIDGYHRVFLARLFGFQKLKAQVVYSADPAETFSLSSSESEEVLRRSSVENGSKGQPAADTSNLDDLGKVAEHRMGLGSSKSARGSSVPDVGCLESVFASEIIGWAIDRTAPDSPIDVEILDGDKLLATVKANCFREDLKKVGTGKGEHRFRFGLPECLKDGRLHLISARVASTKQELANSPLPFIVRIPQMEPGCLEVVSSSEVIGWAWDPANPNSPVSVDIFDGENLIGTVEAEKFRKDLKMAGLGNGEHGFRFALPASLRDGGTHIIRARIANGSANLRHSPKLLITKAEKARTEQPVGSS